MMDFDNILSIASQNQGVSNVQKRYSLQTGPPKKDPKSKGVSQSAIQALLKKQQCDLKTKEMQMMKQKEKLLAKRVELKSDRKARAMASRTKDNFKGYNGIPVVETPKKRKSKFDVEEDRGMKSEQFRNSIINPEDDEDNYEYEQTDSEPEEEPQRNTYNSSSNKSSKKPNAQPKSAPLNFADLLKLAEKKQHEPVEVKAKVVKKEERLRTADEIREMELERKAKRHDKDMKGERVRDGMSQRSSSSTKGTLEKDPKNGNLQKPRMEKHSQLKQGNSSSKSSGHDRDRSKSSQKDKNRTEPTLSSSKATSNKISMVRPTNSQVSAKQMGTKLSSSHKSSDTAAKKDNSVQGRSIGTLGSRPCGSTSTGQKPQLPRPQGVVSKQGASSVAQKREPQRPGINATVKSNCNTSLTNPGFSGRPNQPQARPGGTTQMKSDVRPGASGVRPQGVGQGRPGNGGPASGRGVGAPRCTVVSETISSKNVGGSKGGVPPRPGTAPRPGMQQRPGMPPRLGMPPRPGMPMNRPPGPMLPPITSAYKRKYEDEEDEYDSEMDDFIDDGDDEQEEISKHIKEIFGYDRSKYKEESDYALKFMESSWKDMQKEESRSLRMAVLEDLEEERKEEEEMKKKNAKRQKRN